MSIKYIKGDATSPQGSGIKIIAHIDNNKGGWGRGFVLSLSKKWKSPEAEYRKWYKDRASNNFGLGKVQFVQVENDIFVANMIGQEGVLSTFNKQPIRYDALRECLKAVCEFAKEKNATIHSPRFGSGFAMGLWDEVEKIIIEEFIDKGIEVIIYDL